MKDQLAIQSVLRSKLTAIQSQNPRYSLRAFSKKVGIHVGALSAILNGKRSVSRKIAQRISDRLLLDPQERSEILSLFDLNYSSDKNEPHEPRYLQLQASQFKIAAEWEHFAVLSLIKCNNFSGTPTWIAKRLGITKHRAKQVLERLLELNLIVKDKKSYKRTNSSYRTPDDFADISLKKHHEQSIEIAKQSLYSHSVIQRDFTTITMAIDPKNLATAKEKIRAFEDELSDLLESGNPTEVYRLSVLLFPLTKLEGDKE